MAKKLTRVVGTPDVLNATTALLARLGGDIDFLDHAVAGVPKLAARVRQTGHPTPESVARRQRRNTKRLRNVIMGGYHSAGPSTRMPVAEPSSIATRQNRRAQARKDQIAKVNAVHGVEVRSVRSVRRGLALRPFRAPCRKKGPRGLRAAKQFAQRAGVGIS
jgi:hypothetical protein